VSASGCWLNLPLQKSRDQCPETHLRVQKLRLKAQLVLSLSFLMGMSRNEIWRLAFVLLLGQLISLIMAVASFTSSYIADLGKPPKIKFPLRVIHS